MRRVPSSGMPQAILRFKERVDVAAVGINWAPTVRQLRQFGFIGLAAVPALGWFFSGRPSPSTWGAPTTLMICCAVVGLVLGLLAWLKPSLLKYVFIGATLAAFPIGFVLSELIIFLIYILLFVPVALAFRCMGRDALAREIDREAATYWIPKETPKDAESYFRQS